MNRSFYEDILEKNTNRSIDAEKMWDERAAQFNHPTEKSHSGFTEDTIRILEESGLIRGCDILDVGGGGGRYAVPLARLANHVTMTDISGNMIAFAKEKAQVEGVQNIDFVKMNWGVSDISEHQMESRYDLVFASMCPAVKTKEGLEAMNRASRRACAISQYIVDTDSLTEFVKKRAGLAPKFHPHNDRDGVIAICNILWMDGYDPSIQYLQDSQEFALDSNAVLESHAALWMRVREESDLTPEELIAEYSEAYHGTILKYRKVALVSWVK